MLQNPTWRNWVIYYLPHLYYYLVFYTMKQGPGVQVGWKQNKKTTFPITLQHKYQQSQTYLTKCRSGALNKRQTITHSNSQTLELSMKGNWGGILGSVVFFFLLRHTARLTPVFSCWVEVMGSKFIQVTSPCFFLSAQVGKNADIWQDVCE